LAADADAMVRAAELDLRRALGLLMELYWGATRLGWILLRRNYDLDAGRCMQLLPAGEDLAGFTTAVAAAG